MAKKLTQRKAQKIAKEGLKSAGDGFHSERQRRFVHHVAGGGKQTKVKKQK